MRTGDTARFKMLRNSWETLADRTGWMKTSAGQIESSQGGLWYGKGVLGCSKPRGNTFSRERRGPEVKGERDGLRMPMRMPRSGSSIHPDCRSCDRGSLGQKSRIYPGEKGRILCSEDKHHIFCGNFHPSAHNPEKAMATHSSTLAWRIPCTEEPCGLQSLGLQKVRHD